MPRVMRMVPSTSRTFAKATVGCLFALFYLKEQIHPAFDYTSVGATNLDQNTAPQIEAKRPAQRRHSSWAKEESRQASSLKETGLWPRENLLPKDELTYIDDTNASTIEVTNPSKARNTGGKGTVQQISPEIVSDGTSFQYNGSNSFGACLIWMDDYASLIEWIAYHYHVLPLRHLVIFRDPKSAMDPSPILDRWRPYMNITFWTKLSEFTYVPAIQILNMLKHKPAAHHNKQQGMLNRNCLNHLKRHGWTWTFLADTDEFLLLNKFAVPNAREKMKQPGIIMDTLKDVRSSNNANQSNNKTSFSFKSERQYRRWGNASNFCVTMMRQQYSSFESPKEVIEADVPPFMDPYRFQTMRFRYHKKNTMIGKSIVDASRVSVDASTVMSPHRVIRECGNPYGFSDDLMHVNHYLGTWEHFRRPNDFRGVQMRFQKFIELNEAVKVSMQSHRSDEIRPWLQGFVESMGKDTALSLLEGVGFPYNSSTALHPKKWSS
eukprot:scaffold12013_cov163-Cylindrotheca_fusiformis.AAC.1